MFTEDVSDLLRMLTLFQRKNEAAELQTDFEQLLQFIEKCVPDIWTLDLTNGACTQKPVSRTENFCLLLKVWKNVTVKT